MVVSRIRFCYGCPVSETKRLHFLVVDDDRAVREMVRTYLEDLGVGRVHEAGDGDEALIALRRHPLISFVILDWELPGISGLDFVRRIRQDRGFSRTYVMMLTARADEKGMREALEAGIDDFLVKPFPIQKLKAKLDRALDTDRRLHAVRFGEFLVQGGLITAEQLEVGLECQRHLDVSRLPLGALAVAGGMCEPHVVLRRLCDSLGARVSEPEAVAALLQSGELWSALIGPDRFRSLVSLGETGRLMIGETFVGLNFLTRQQLESHLASFFAHRKRGES